MSHLPMPSENDLSQEARFVLDEFQKNYGRPSHIFRAISWNGRFVGVAADAWRKLVVEPSTLDRWIKEAIVVITCSTQGTQYCVQGHSHALHRQGLSKHQVEAIQTHTFEGFADPERSIFQFAQKAAGAPKSLARADFEHLEKQNISKETILEILGVIWVNTAMNMIVDAMGVVRTEEQMKELERL